MFILCGWGLIFFGLPMEYVHEDIAYRGNRSLALLGKGTVERNLIDTINPSA